MVVMMEVPVPQRSIQGSLAVPPRFFYDNHGINIAGAWVWFIYWTLIAVGFYVGGKRTGSRAISIQIFTLDPRKSAQLAGYGVNI
jgi:hypothetical protein